MVHKLFTASTNFAREIKVVHRIDLHEFAATAAPATVQIRDTDANGPLMVPIELAADESKHITFDPPIRCPGGAYVLISVGAARGTITGE